MRDLRGMVAWITGAGSGIGEGAAFSLAREGVKVFLTGRRREPLELVASSIIKLGGSAEVAQGDAKDRKGMQNIANNIIKKHGKIDLLFNINLLPLGYVILIFKGSNQFLSGTSMCLVIYPFGFITKNLISSIRE